MEALSRPADPFRERRKLPRISLKVPVHFRNLLKDSERFLGSVSRDLSADGVGITAWTFLPKEARLVLTILFPGGLPPIRMLGRVAWVSVRPGGSPYDYGIQFTEIDPSDCQRIADYVERGVVV